MQSKVAKALFRQSDQRHPALAQPPPARVRERGLGSVPVPEFPPSRPVITGFYGAGDQSLLDRLVRGVSDSGWRIGESGGSSGEAVIA